MPLRSYGATSRQFFWLSRKQRFVTRTFDRPMTHDFGAIRLTERPREGLYRLPTDRQRNRRPRESGGTYRSASSIHQMPHASSSIMPIPITSTASATGSGSRANAAFSICMTHPLFPLQGPIAGLARGWGTPPNDPRDAGPVHAVPCPAKPSTLGQPQWGPPPRDACWFQGRG